MIPGTLSPIANHLWQSTLFAAVAGLLTLALRKNAAGVRHWVWVSASVKFLVPFSLLISLISQVPWRTGDTPSPGGLTTAWERAGEPFTPAEPYVGLGSIPRASNSL